MTKKNWFKEDLSADILQLRRRLGWTRAELGFRMGCRSEIIEMWESGKLIPELEAINQLKVLLSQVEALSERVQQTPLTDLRLSELGLSQFNRCDHFKEEI